MPAASTSRTQVATPSDREIHIKSVFSAPRSLVFEAWTKVEHLRRWWGVQGMELLVCDLDFRVGGGYRFVARTPDGREVAFRGVYTVSRKGSLAAISWFAPVNGRPHEIGRATYFCRNL